MTPYFISNPYRSAPVLKTILLDFHPYVLVYIIVDEAGENLSDSKMQFSQLNATSPNSM